MEHQFTIFTRAVAGLLTASCLVSCSKQVSSVYDAPGEPIRFSATAGRTKAVVSEECLPDSYTIYASAHFTNSTDPANSGNYFLSKPFRDNAGVWESSPAVYWPLGGKLDFLAVACEDESFDLIGKSVWNSSDCTKNVEISVGDGECLDSELLFSASADRTSESGGMSLQFNHSQSWLQFVANCDMEDILRIDKIIIENVYTGGILTISNDITLDAEWSFRGHSRNNRTVPGSEGVIMAAGISPVCSILLPEQEACDISLYYSIRPSSTDDWSTAESSVFHHKSSGNLWYNGEKTIYTIKTSIREVTFTPSIEAWTDEKQDIEVSNTGEHIDITDDMFDLTAAPNRASFKMKIDRSWTAISSEPWITVNETSGDPGENTVNFTVSGNTLAGVPRTGTITVFLEGSSVTGTVTVRQEGDAITNTSYVIEDISASPSTIGAAGGQAVVSGGAGTLTRDWVSGTQTTESFTANKAVTSPAEISSDGLVTVPANDGTGRSFTVTYSYPDATSKSCVITQVSDDVSYYDAPTGLSITCSDVPAGGGSVTSGTVSGTCSQVVHYVSGATETIHPAYSGSWRGGASCISSKGTVESARSSTGKMLYYDYEVNGKAGTASCEIYQEANFLGSQHYKDTAGTPGDNTNTTTSTTYGTPTVSIGSGLTAGGGSATVTASVTDRRRTITTTTWFQKYRSGSYTGEISGGSESSDVDVVGTVDLSITENGNNRFSLSGTTLSHNSMADKVTTDKVTVTAKNHGDSSRSATASKSIANEVTGTTYSIDDICASPSSVDSYGGKVTINGGAGTSITTYTSGYEATGTFTPNKSVDSPASISGNSVTIPGDYKGTKERTFTVTYSYSGVESTCTITQTTSGLEHKIENKFYAHFNEDSYIRPNEGKYWKYDPLEEILTLKQGFITCDYSVETDVTITLSFMTNDGTIRKDVELFLNEGESRNTELSFILTGVTEVKSIDAQVDVFAPADDEHYYYTMVYM